MQITLAGRNFDAGYKSDIARDQLATGDAYRMYDYIPQLGTPLARRGGWDYSTADLNALSAVANIASVSWVPIQGDPHLLVVGNNGKVYLDRLINKTGGVYIGSSGVTSVTQRPFWFADLNGMVILQGLVGSPVAPQKYTVSSGSGTSSVYGIAALGGSPPQASVGAPYGDWLLLANGWISGTRYANRIWASALTPPLGEVWNNTVNFFDLPEEIVRVIPLRSTILVFGYRSIWMLTGDTPPPGGNWAKQDAYAIGTMDGRSVVAYRDTVLFANNAGVFQTDGVTLTDLTEQGGISQHWQELVANFNFSTGWSACAGVYQGNYLIVVHDAAGNFVTCHVCDIQNRVWFEFTNIRARMFAERQSGPGTALADGHEELFFAHSTLPRACMISPCWGPPASGPTDDDGIAVRPVIELPFYKLGTTGLKQIRNAWITHDLRDGGFVPYFQLDAMLTPNASAYVPLISNTADRLIATTQERRRPVWIRKRALGVGLRIAQVNASANTALAEIEFESRPLSGARRG